MSSWGAKNRPVKKPVIFKEMPNIVEQPKIVQTESDIITEVVSKIRTNENTIVQIPKIAFTFWEGKEFSYLHYLTIKTFAFYNPDFRIIIYSTTNNQDSLNKTWGTHEHSVSIKNNITDINLLREISNVEFISVNLDEYFSNASNISPIYKSDFLRILKLKEHGGIWLDFDILFFKKVPEYLLNLGKNEIGIFMYENVIAIGFIFSHPNNPILDYIFNNSYNNIKNNLLLGYESIGSHIWTKLVTMPTISSFIKLLSNNICYSYLWNNLDKLYKTNVDLTTDETIAIHWYNGAVITKDYINNTVFSDINPEECIMNRFIYKVLQDMA